MGVSKNKKKKGKDGQKSKNVNLKCEKNKKLNVDNKLITFDSEHTIFKTDEQHELKKILKINTLTSVPLILGAVILGNFDVVKKLIKQGCDVNATGHDKTSSLMWAVRTKNLEMIDLLVSRGADVTAVDDSGENIIFIALNSTEWDENCFLDFWQSIKKINDINLEFANKTGNKILHFAVKRQWALLIESLIDSKVNINSCNNKGVSALTMAAARNDLKLVNILLNAHANVFVEDHKGNTPICYTIVNIVRKNLKPPYETFDRLMQNFTKENYEHYIDRRLYLLISPPNNDLNSYYPNINKITTAVVSFIMNYIPNGLDILIKLQAFEKLKKAIETHVDHFEYLQSLLSVLSVLLRWCECCIKLKNVVPPADISEKFIQSEIADILLFVLKVYNGTNSMKQLLPNVFLPYFLTCSQSSIAKNWLKEHLEQLEIFYQQYLDICVVNFNIKEDERHIQVIKYKIKTFKETFDELKAELVSIKEIEMLVVNETKEEIVKIEEEKFEQPPQHGRKHAKRMRRKARALKARIDKIRSADVVERIRIHTKNKTSSSSCIISEDIKESSNSKEELKIFENKDDKEIIEIKLNHPVDSSSAESVEVQQVVINDEGFANNYIITSNSNDSGVLTQDTYGYYDCTMKVYLDDKHDLNRKAEFGATIIRLQILLNDIICKYKFLWAMDAKKGHPHFLGGQGDNFHPLLEGSREEQLKKLKSILPYIEKHYLTQLVENFNKAIDRIKNLFLQNNEEYNLLVDQLRNLLIEHEIRGEKYLKRTFDKENDEPYDTEVIPGKYGTIGDHLRKNKTLRNEFNSEEDEPYTEDFVPGKFGAIGDHLRPETPDFQNDLNPPTYLDLIDNIIPPKFQLFQQLQNDISAPDLLYLREMSAITFQTSKLTIEEKQEIQKKTEDNSYHLLKSAYDICESDNIFEGWDEDYISPYMRRMLQREKERKERGFSSQPTTYTSLAALEQEQMSSNDTAQDVASCGKVVAYCPDIDIDGPLKTSRWQSRIQNLQTVIKQQMTTKGEDDDGTLMLIVSKECVGKFTLATKGRFGGVDLGFDKQGKPLIIKRINSATIKQVYSCIHSVMEVKHKHLLSYTICSYDPVIPSLFLGTPLCEYNLGEYMMMLKTQHTAPVIATGLVNQLLLGLQHLHRFRPEPIVHGNLKPSNVLIDLRGMIRLAEFGLYQTLYLRDRAPTSSLIWFARETYEAYETQKGGMHCSLATDMQVAGMLVHFTLTWGLHVFGVGADEILCNILAGRPKIQDVGIDAEDLISWMIVYKWNDRPSIAQVLNHIYFWPESEKWRFLLTCSGLTENGSPLPDLPLQHFHSFLEIFAKQEGILGDWVSIIKRGFPNMDVNSSGNKVEKDTPTGLLKFMRRMVLEEKYEDLKELILEAFPALPLSLFRLIENTEWLRHPAFRNFFRY